MTDLNSDAADALCSAMTTTTRPHPADTVTTRQKVGAAAGLSMVTVAMFVGAVAGTVSRGVNRIRR